MKDLALTTKERAGILRRRQAAEARKTAGKTVARPAKPPIDDGTDYMAWLHRDIPCIACLILGPTGTRIEAAHQKLQLAERGFTRALGRRGSHFTCVPLCAAHHRTGSPCCDPAQAKFWAILGFTPEGLADFIEALIAAYREDAPGADVVRQYSTRRAA